MTRDELRTLIITTIDDWYWPPDETEKRPANFESPGWLDNPQDRDPRYDGNLPLDAIVEAIYKAYGGSD